MISSPTSEIRDVMTGVKALLQEPMWKDNA